MSSITPKSYIITQVSNSISGSNAVVPNSSNQISDVYSSIGIASENNFGNMNLIGLGIPEEKSLIDLRIQNSGTIVNESTFVWRIEDGDYYGTNDFRYMSGYRAPFSRPTIATVSDVPQACHGCTAIYADFLRREFLYYVKHVSNRNVVHVAYRNVDGIDIGTVEETQGFTLADITLPVRFQSSSGDLAQIDVCKTIQNTLLMICSADQDLQLFESTDGLNWTLVASNILKRFITRDIDYASMNITSLKIASSGSYVRIVFASKSSNHNEFFILGSSDYGLSFKELNVDTPIDSELAKVDTYSNYAYAMDLCAVRDSDGSFMMVVGYNNPLLSTSPSAKAQTKTYLGIANTDFAELDENIIYHDRVFINMNEYHSKGYIVRFGKLFLCKTDSHIYLFDTGRVPLTYPNNLYYSSSTSSTVPKQEMKFSYEIRMWRMPLDGLVSSNRWESLNGKTKGYSESGGQYGGLTDINIGTTGLCNGGGRYWFGRSKFYFIGNCISCFGTMVDTENGGIDVARHQYFRMNTFSRMPVYDTFPKGYSLSAVPSYAGKHQPSGKLFNLEWSAIYGLPEGIQYGSADTSYELYTTNNTDFIISLGSQDSSWYILNQTNKTIGYTVEISKYLYKDDYNFVGGGTLLAGGMFYEIVFGLLDSDFDYSSASVSAQRPFYIRFRDQVRISSTSRYTVDLTVSIDQEGVFIDNPTPTKIFDHNDLSSGSTPFEDYVWEMRIVSEATALTSPIGANLRVLLRRKDQSHYHTSSVFSLDIQQDTNVNVDYVSSIDVRLYSAYIGTPDPNPRIKVISWKYHTNSSLGHLDENGDDNYSDYTKIRGRNCNTVGTLTLADNMRLAFGGGSAAEGDTFQLVTQDVYDVNNTIGSSLLNWQSATDTTDSYIIFESNKNAFAHNGWGVFGLNCKDITIEYSNDITFATSNVITNIDLSTGIVGRIDSVFEGNQTVEVTFDSLQGFQDLKDNGLVSTDKNNLYARFTTLSASTTNIALDESFKIIDHFDNKLILDGTSDILTASVGSTLTIYSDRIVIRQSSIDDTIKKYMKLTMSGDTFEGYHTLGTIVAGQVIDFDVPMDWSFTDEENANIQNNLSRSGVKWGYPEGPPTRTISGRIIGDVSQYQRSKIRTALRKQQYSANPLVLVLEESSKQTTHPNNVVLSRYTNEHSMDNAGWYYDETTETWYAVGDLSITFEEDV